MAGSRVAPRFFAALEGDILSEPIVMEVVEGRRGGGTEFKYLSFAVIQFKFV